MTDIQEPKQLGLKNIFPPNYLPILIEDIKVRLLALPDKTIVPNNLLADLKYAISLGSEEALTLFVNTVLTKSTRIPPHEKLHYLEVAASNHPHAAFFCGCVYLGLDLPDGFDCFDAKKAINYLKLASKLQHKTAYFLLISAMLEGALQTNEVGFLKICKELVQHGDLYAGVYCASVLCHYYPNAVKDHVKLQVNINIDLAYHFIMIALKCGKNDKDLIKEVALLINRGFKDNIWSQDHANTFLDYFKPAAEPKNTEGPNYKHSR